MSIDLDDVERRIADGIDDLDGPFYSGITDDAFSALAEIRAEVERLRADLDFLARAVVQAVVASSLAAGETLVDPIPHIIVSTVTRLRAEALGQRADNAEIGALAYADGAEAERAAVVTWLQAASQRWAVDDPLNEAADAIERGEHRREEDAP